MIFNDVALQATQYSLKSLKEKETVNEFMIFWILLIYVQMTIPFNQIFVPKAGKKNITVT